MNKQKRMNLLIMSFGVSLIVTSFGVGIQPAQAFEHGFGGPAAGGGSFGSAAASKRHGPPAKIPSFPKYPAGRAAVGGPGHVVVNHVPGRVDSLGNRVTEDHLNRVDFAHNRSELVMRNDVHVNNVVRVGRAHFANFYRPEFEHRSVFFNGYVNHYNSIVYGHPPFLNVWYNHSFHGGLYWGFHPILDIDTYFYNPMVYWFYVGAADRDYYHSWYRDEYSAYPELSRPFAYHGIYYPTENLKQLLFGVSAMPVDKQARFRTGITTFTQRLAQNMANGLGTHVKLQNGDIAVTHYEVLGYDDAVDLEGLVTFNNQGYNFKGIVDMENPERSDVFVPATWDKNPSPEQLSKLDSLNERINAIKGVPSNDEKAEGEPEAPPTTGGDASADPEHN